MYVDLSKYFDFELRQQQKFAFKNLRFFLNQKDKNVFILKGYAGIGKTTLMGDLIKLLNEKKFLAYYWRLLEEPLKSFQIKHDWIQKMINKHGLY